MKIIICENYDELSEKAFEVMKSVVTGSDRPIDINVLLPMILKYMK